MAQSWTTGAERAEAFKADAEETANTIAEQASEFAREAKKRAQTSLKALEETVKDYPLQSVLLGVGIGLALSLVFMAARKKAA